MIFKVRKGITESFSILMLIMMMLLISGATLFWFDYLSSSSKTSTEIYALNLEQKIISSADIVSEDYKNGVLSIFIENRGLRDIPVREKMSIVLYNGKQIICARDYYRLECISGCETDIRPGVMRRIDILLNKDCNISQYNDQIRYVIDFGGVVGVASEFKQ